MKIINATPHPINVVDAEGNQIAQFPASGVLPRLAQTTERVREINGIPISETQFGETENLPEAEENTYYIVSRLVMAGNPGREDLLVPNEIVRDENGRIIGCQSLARN